MPPPSTATPAGQPLRRVAAIAGVPASTTAVPVAAAPWTKRRLELLRVSSVSSTDPSRGSRAAARQLAAWRPYHRGPG